MGSWIHDGFWSQISGVNAIKVAGGGGAGPLHRCAKSLYLETATSVVQTSIQIHEL